MELVTHTCGAQLRRHFDGRTWIPSYYTADETREIRMCPQCGVPLADAALSDADGQPVANAATRD